MAGARLEEILGQLLVPNNEAIQQATQQLKDAVKDPAIIPSLCQVLTTSQNPQVRQYAAVLLRRRILKQKQWSKVPPDVAQNIRENLLQVLLQEPEKAVRNSLAQVVATVAKHDLPQGQWQEIFQFFQEYIQSEDVQKKEVGLFVLSTVASSAAEQLVPHITSLLQLFHKTLSDEQSMQVPFYTIQAMTSIVPYIGSEEVKCFQPLVPKILEVITQLIANDQDKACEAFEILDEMIECEVSIVVPHVKTIVEFCLQVGSRKDLEDKVRVKALSFVSWLTRLKKKTILKHKMVGPILSMLFPIMCEKPSDADEDEEFEEAESQTAPSFAAQVLDIMALNVPPEKIIPHVMQYVEPGLQSQDEHQRKAAYLAIGVTTEGCADHIREKYLQALFQCVYKGISDPSVVVRHAVLFTIGQFAEYLQPDISKYSKEILPLLFDYLNKAQNDKADPKGVTKIYFALEMFCENLGKDILPYLETLVNHLVTTLSSEASPHTKELAISAVGAIANAAQMEIAPYFPQISERLKAFLIPSESGEDLTKLQVQAIDTLGVLARNMGKDYFLPLANECVQLSLNLIANATDPDLRRSIYGLYAALSTILKADMGPFLGQMVKQMLESLKSVEGVTAHFDEEESQMFHVFDEEDIEDDEAENDEDVKGFSVENAYLDEKEDACCALGELALNTKSAFMSYLEESYTEVDKLAEYPASDVRKGAITALGQFCQAVHAVSEEASSPEATAALTTMVANTVPKFLLVVRKDLDRQVAMTALDTLNEMLENIRDPVLQITGKTEDILLCVKEVLEEKTACQDQAEEDTELDDQKAEYDEMLLENAGEIVPSVAKLMGGEAFLPYFTSFLPEFLKRLKPTSTVAERSFAVGTLAEMVQACGGVSVNFVQMLYPVFMKGMKDPDDEVRSNSVFAVGVLAANGGEVMVQNYPHILKEFFDMLVKETDGRTLDNICGATCRLIWTNISAVPMDQVFPVVVRCLPLRVDFEENSTVFTCIGELYRTNHEQVLKHLPELLTVFSLVLGTTQIKKEIETLLVQMVQSIHKTRQDELQIVIQSLPEPQADKLKTCLVMVNGS